MIYLKEGNIPLNLCTDDDIFQQENNTYQLTFKYPVSDRKWILLQNEVHLLADDLSGEQEFVIIDVQKGNGYITVYANQVATLLNGYSIRKINVDRVNGFTVMSKLVEGLKRECPFTFFSDISGLHTLNIKNVSVIDALLKGQHSIVGQWGGDLVRDKYSVRLLKNGGIENQSLFMYKKNLSEYKESTTTKSLKTRIHFRKAITASGEGEKGQILETTVDSPLIDKYKHIYEYDMEVQDQDVKTIDDLKVYGKKYFQSSLCDLPDESLEIDVLGHADQPVKLFDTVSIFYELYNVDIRKKITSYNYSPMSKKLKKIGFGKISRSLGGAIGKIVRDVVKEKIASHDAEYEAKVQKLVDNANAEYDKQSKELKQNITDGIEQAKAQAEVLKKEVTDSVNSKFADFDRSFNTQLDSQKERIQAINELANDANRVATEALRDGNNAIKYALSVKSLADHNFTTVRNLNDKIDLLATKQELDPITERLRLTESQIELQADQITEKLSRTEVDRLIDGKGFQNAVQVQNIVKKSVDGFQQTISRVENKLRDVIRNDNLLQNSSTIPTGNGLEGTWRPNISGGNGRTEVVSLTDAPHTAIKKGIRIVGNTNGGNKDFGQFVNLEIGQKYTISCWARVHSNSSQNNVNFLMRSYTSNDRNRILVKNISNRDWVRYQFTFTADAVNNSIQFGQNGNGSLEICGMKLEHSDRMTDYDVNTSEIVSVVEFNDVVDTVKSHTQTIQRQNESISQVIQTADGLVTRVSNFLDDFNLVYDPTNFSKWKKKQPEANIIEVQASTKLLRITNSGNTNNVYRGFALPLNTSTFTKDEKLSYRIEAWVDVLPDAPLGIELWNDNSVIASDRVTFSKTGTQVITGTMTVNKTTTNSRDFPLEFWLLKNGTVAIGKVSLIRGDSPPKKFTDNTSTQDIATQTQVSKLAGSYAIKNLNSAGDIINGINIAADGNNRIDGRLTHITGQTLIDNAVIKSAMVDKLKTGNFESASVTTQILASNAVTADKLLVDSAMINKLVSNQAFIKELFTQRATITQIQSIDITGEHVRGGRITSLNGGTVINLQDGWIDTNQEGVGIRNRFPGRPLQYLVFGTGEIGGVPGAYTSLMSNRNGIIGMEHTSAGIQIWNGRKGSNVQTAITFYGRTMDFLPSSQGGGVSINTETKVLWGMEDVVIKGISLVSFLKNIDYNFEQIINHFKQNDLGWPAQRGLKF
ncbi:phage tail protein [Streptococcus sp. GS001]|uniref:phage tail spike protein n=1 Tax=Streptococcus sp. GS001 TaxID=2766953 RepID=UPI001F2B7B5B|nr:phage tail spike protein [Streptococcus sp. GS001]MCF4964664.1 phage tail protein [Streptococcus sp. GS001]